MRLGLFLEIPGLEDLFHVLKLLFLLHLIVDQDPGAILILIHFAFTFICTAAWAVHQALGAQSNRAYPPGLIQHALPAQGTLFQEIPLAVHHRAKDCVQRRQYRQP